MPKNTIAYYTKAGRFKSTVVPATTSTVIFTAGADGSKVLTLNIGNLSGTGSIDLIANDGTTDNLILRITAASDLDLLNATLLPKAANAMRYMNLETGWTLKIVTTGTAAFTAMVYAENY